MIEFIVYLFVGCFVAVFCFIGFMAVIAGLGAAGVGVATFWAALTKNS